MTKQSIDETQRNQDPQIKKSYTTELNTFTSQYNTHHKAIQNALNVISAQGLHVGNFRPNLQAVSLRRPLNYVVRNEVGGRSQYPWRFEPFFDDHFSGTSGVAKAVLADLEVLDGFKLCYVWWVSFADLKTHIHLCFQDNKIIFRSGYGMHLYQSQTQKDAYGLDALIPYDLCRTYHGKIQFIKSYYGETTLTNIHVKSIVDVVSHWYRFAITSHQTS